MDSRNQRPKKPLLLSYHLSLLLVIAWQPARTVSSKECASKWQRGSGHLRTAGKSNYSPVQPVVRKTKDTQNFCFTPSGSSVWVVFLGWGTAIAEPQWVHHPESIPTGMLKGDQQDLTGLARSECHSGSLPLGGTADSGGQCRGPRGKARDFIAVKAPRPMAGHFERRQWNLIPSGSNFRDVLWPHFRHLQTISADVQSICTTKSTK